MSEGSDHIFSLVDGSEPEPSVKENSVRSVEDDKGVSGGSTSQTGSKKTSKEDTDNESTDGEQLSSSSHGKDLGYAADRKSVV